MSEVVVDHRAYLYNALEKYIKKLEGYVKDEEEFAHVTNVMKFIERESQCFKRSCLEGHITGSSWILNRKGDKALLTHHKKLDIWVQLGGHSDGDCNTNNVAFREAYEESGFAQENLKFMTNDIFDVDVHLIPENKKKNEPAHYHYDVRYLLQVTDDEDYIVSDESHDLGWFNSEEIVKLNPSVSISRMVSKWKELNI